VAEAAAGKGRRLAEPALEKEKTGEKVHIPAILCPIICKKQGKGKRIDFFGRCG
jgi:hypothetical protein